MMHLDEPLEHYRVETSIGQKGTCYVYADGFEVHWDKLIVANMMETPEDYGLRQIQ